MAKASTRILDSTSSNWFLVTLDAVDFTSIVVCFVDVVSLS
jgi:hypothetical protein